MSHNLIWLIGGGPMAVDYAKVLQALNKDFITIGRGSGSAKKFRDDTGLDIIEGGLDLFLKKKPEQPKCAIIAASVLALPGLQKSLLAYGVKQVLVEKPAALSEKELDEIISLRGSENIYLGYNRRFYSSVLEAKKWIKEDGGLSSFHFEFTEWSHIIKDLKEPLEVKNKWILANSSHIIDMAFFLGGFPEKIFCHSSGQLDWHQGGGVFLGAGISEKQVPFTYHSNWQAPGRWTLEFLTKKRRILFKPIEKIQFQEIGSVVLQQFTLEDSLDEDYKPGLYRQVKYFLEGDFSSFSNLKSQKKLINLICNSILEAKNF